MYYVRKTIEISAAHSLKLSYPSKCSSLHGHNWIFTIFCRAETLNPDGMVTDFSHIKQTVKQAFDHAVINDVIPLNPTAENIARWVVEHVDNCYRCEVQESEGNMAAYELDTL